MTQTEARGEAASSERERGPAPQARGGLQTAGLALLVAATAFLRAFPGRHVGFLADDYCLATDEMSSLFLHSHRSLFRPLPDLIWRLADLDSAVAMHLLLAGLHAGNALLVFLLVRRITRREYAALLAGLIFGVHPMITEAVSWASCLYDVSAVFGILCSLLCFQAARGAEGRRRGVYYGLCLVWYGVALGCKEIAVTVPLLALVLAWPVRLNRETVRLAAAFTALTVGYLYLRAMNIAQFNMYPDYPVFGWHSASLAAPLTHLGRYFFPVHRYVLEGHEGVRRAFVLMMLAATAALLVAARRHPSRWRWLALFLVCCLPTWHLPVTAPGLREGRFSYLLLVVLAGFTGEVLASVRKRRATVLAFPVIGVLLAMSLWYLEPWYQARRTADALVAQTVAVVRGLPRKPLPHVYVGNMPRFENGAYVLVNGYEQAVVAALVLCKANHERISPGTIDAT